MSNDPDILIATEGYSAREKAAALGHWVYARTAAMDIPWNSRVADLWEELDEAARDFNLAAVDTWASHPDVLRAWHDAVNASATQTS